MSTVSDANRRAAIEAAARRAREEAARQAQLAAQQKAREAALQKASLTAGKKTLQPTKKFSVDEMSNGRGSALRARQLATTGAFIKPLNVAPTTVRNPDAPLAKTTPSTVAPTTARPLSSTEQAKVDAATVAQTHQSTIDAGGSQADAAKEAAAALERLATQHQGDSAYINSLVREAGPTLDKIATTLGENANGKHKSNGDSDAIKDAIHSLSVVAEQGGAITAATIATKLAGKVSDDSELHNFDDGFYEHKDAGGTNLLFDATVAVLAAQGKEDAAGELSERGGDGGFIDDIQDAAGNVIDFVGDVGSGALHLVTEAGEFAVDVAEGTLEVIGDVANFAADKVGDAVQYAVEQGLKLAGPIVDRVRDLAKEGIDSGLGITENINSLTPGDSLNIGGSFHAQLGVSIDASAEISVSLDTDASGKPVYTVSGEVDASVGIGAGGSASAGVGGKMEFTFDNAEDAARAAKILAAGAAGAAALAGGATAVLAPALLPSPGDLSFLYDNLKSIEVSGSVGASFDSAGGAADVSVEGTSSYRLDFEDGKPVSITRSTEVSAEGKIGGPLEVLKDSLGNAITIDGDATAEGSVTIETTIPLDAAGITDVAAFIASPTTAAIAGPAETSITIAGTFTVAGRAGVTGELKIDDIDSSEVTSVIGNLFEGDLGNVFEGVEVVASGSVTTFRDDADGFDFDFDGTVAGQGVEVSAHNEVRREVSSSEFEVELG